MAEDTGDTTGTAITVEAQPLASALRAFSDQSGLQVAYVATLAENKTSRGTHGAATVEGALSEILATTGLEYRFVNDGTVAIAAAETEQGGDRDPGKARGRKTPIPMAQNGRAAAATAEPNDDDRTAAGTAAREERQLDEIIVTGTHIRGTKPVGSHVLVMDRATIDETGLGTVQDVVRTLPQNYPGGVNAEDAIIGDSLNVSGSAGVNLRGLGEDATLVLVNGRRQPVGTAPRGENVDISSLPLAAIERVEVLPDGASALYGADAIGGVVNFVLRDDYQGAETRVRYGSVTDGGTDEFQASQSFGMSGRRGNILAVYEYYSRSALPASERPYAANSDLTAFGGENHGWTTSNPGNIVGMVTPNGEDTVQYAIPPGQDGTGLTAADLIPGVENLSNTHEGRWLLGEQKRHSAFVSGTLNISDKLRAFSELRYSKRNFEMRRGGEEFHGLEVPDTNPYFVAPDPTATSVYVDYNGIEDFGALRRIGDVKTYVGVFGFDADFAETWNAEIYASVGSETTTDTENWTNRSRLDEALGFDDPATPFDPNVDGYFNPFADGSNTPQNVLDYIAGGFSTSRLEGELRTVNATVTGELFHLPGGSVRAALGGHYREETLKRSAVDFDSGLEPSSRSLTDSDRDVTAFFAELLVPVVGEDNRVPGVHSLEFSLAARYEDYSDFGSSADPRFGLEWSPSEAVTLRATYGKSFKAPTLFQFAGSKVWLAWNVQDPTSPTGTSVGLVLQGANDDLQEENSTAWTTGFTVTPVGVPGLTFGATYFSVEYVDRIDTLPQNPFTLLLNEDLYTSVITRDPDTATVQTFLDSDHFLPFYLNPAASEVQVILDGRINNIAVMEVHGLDVNLDYDFGTDLGDFSIGLNGSYLMDFEQAFTDTAPLVDFVDTLNNPLSLRLRGRLAWSRNAWNAVAFVNYTGSYENTLRDPAERIDSLTTVDLHIRYDFGRGASSPTDGLFASLSVQNLFDREPPRVIDPIGLAYDSENADPLGRFVALQITKEW